MAQTASHGQNTNAFGMVLLGAAMGALAALLMAPKKGDDMRDDIKDRYYGMKTKTHDTIDTAKDKVRSTTDRFRSKTHDIADDARDAMEEASQQSKEAADRIADKADRMMDETDSSTRNSRKSM